jgi:hypothetical protein
MGRSADVGDPAGAMRFLHGLPNAEVGQWARWSPLIGQQNRRFRFALGLRASHNGARSPGAEAHGEQRCGPGE